jgi:hypothetical protein
VPSSTPETNVKALPHTGEDAAPARGLVLITP